MIDDSCEDRKLENLSTLHIEFEEICDLVVNEDLLKQLAKMVMNLTLQPTTHQM